MISSIKKAGALGFPWETQDPFLFCVYHHDLFPAGDENMGPVSGREGRGRGNDFVVKDGYRMYHGDVVPGFPAHPHRGFETVTIAERGIVDHADSLGAEGRFGWGDVQWMTAGKGVQHSEMFPLVNEDKGNELLLFQIWLNLHSSKKMVTPHYRMLWNKEIPVKETEAYRLKLIHGDFDSISNYNSAPDSWAADKEHQVIIAMIELKPGGTLRLPDLPEGINRSLYFYEGNDFSYQNQRGDKPMMLTFNPGKGGKLSSEDGAKFLLLQGKPMGEPVVQQGPFVMNYPAEIRETMLDYQKDQFGGWPWPRPDHVQARDQKRFARHGDGREEYPD